MVTSLLFGMVSLLSLWSPPLLLLLLLLLLPLLFLLLIGITPRLAVSCTPDVVRNRRVQVVDDADAVMLPSLLVLVVAAVADPLAMPASCRA